MLLVRLLYLFILVKMDTTVNAIVQRDAKETPSMTNTSGNQFKYFKVLMIKYFTSLTSLPRKHGLGRFCLENYTGTR